VAGSTPNSLREYYEDLSETGRVVIKNVSHGTRVWAQPFTTPDGVAGVVIVTERLGAYEEAERLALIVSLVTGGLTTAAAAGISAWATRRALRPVAEMASTATDWSEHDLGRRFGLGGPTNEITALAGTLDTLLDKVSLAIRSEQRLTSELAHELRTPLTTIRGRADLILLRNELPAAARVDLMEISAVCGRMSATIATLLELARTETSMVDASQSSMAEILAEIHQESDSSSVSFTVEPTEARVAVPKTLGVRAIAPVVENALRFARTSVRLVPRTSDGAVELVVEDDGPGVDSGEPDAPFEPGIRSTGGGGSGLGLALSRRILRSVGGDVKLVESTGSRTRFVIILPLA
jgi:two-component system OmpR family sensor kinase